MDAGPVNHPMHPAHSQGDPRGPPASPASASAGSGNARAAHSRSSMIPSAAQNHSPHPIVSLTPTNWHVQMRIGPRLRANGAATLSHNPAVTRLQPMPTCIRSTAQVQHPATVRRPTRRRCRRAAPLRRAGSGARSRAAPAHRSGAAAGGASRPSDPHSPSFRRAARGHRTAAGRGGPLRLHQRRPLARGHAALGRFRAAGLRRPGAAPRQDGAGGVRAARRGVVALPAAGRAACTDGAAALDGGSLLRRAADDRAPAAALRRGRSLRRRGRHTRSPRAPRRGAQAGICCGGWSAPRRRRDGGCGWRAWWTICLPPRSPGRRVRLRAGCAGAWTSRARPAGGVRARIRRSVTADPGDHDAPIFAIMIARSRTEDVRPRHTCQVACVARQRTACARNVHLVQRRRVWPRFAAQRYSSDADALARDLPAAPSRGAP